jgi:ribosomal-protein-alanine N-acetyltransferase
MDIAIHRPAVTPDSRLRRQLAMGTVTPLTQSTTSIPEGVTCRTDIQWAPQALITPAATIRELQPRDASVLCSLLTTEPVTRFIYPPPTDTDGFVRFIEWTREEQEAGRQITFAMVAPGQDTAAGVIQVRSCDAEFSRAEWGFVLGERYWGSGLFTASAEIVLRFLFECVGVKRLEARSVALNGRGNGVLHKLGATKEGRLRRAFSKDGKCFDEVLWTLRASDWRRGRRLPARRSQ